MKTRKVVYRGTELARVAKYGLMFKNGKAYTLPEGIAKDLVENHAGFAWSKKDKTGGGS